MFSFRRDAVESALRNSVADSDRPITIETVLASAVWHSEFRVATPTSSSPTDESTETTGEVCAEGKRVVGRRVLGCLDGALEGWALGAVEGCAVVGASDCLDGPSTGAEDGTSVVGTGEGAAVGSGVGLLLGVADGREVGFEVGWPVGCAVGCDEG